MFHVSNGTLKVLVRGEAVSGGRGKTSSVPPREQILLTRLREAQVLCGCLKYHGKYKNDYTRKSSYGGFPDADGTAETVMGEKSRFISQVQSGVMAGG